SLEHVERIESSMCQERSRNGRCDAGFHLEYRLFQTHENSAADDAMADVQLRHFRETRDGRNVLQIQSVARMELHAGTDGCCGRDTEQLEFAVTVGAGSGQSVAAGVELDRRSPKLGRRFDLREIGIDEECDVNTRVATALNGFRDARFLAR